MQNDFHNKVASDNTEDISTQRREFFSYLDAEINNLRSDIQRPGWTKWAILGSVATLTWLLLSQIELGTYSLRNVISLLLVFSLVGWFSAIASSTLDVPGSKYDLKSRFLHMDSLAKNRLVFVLFVGQLTFLIFVVTRFYQDVGALTTAIALSLLLFLLLVIILPFVMVHIKYPLPINRNNTRRDNASLVTLLALSAIVAWRYIDFLRIQPSAVTVADVRLALLIAGIFGLIYMLANVPRGNLMLDSLIMTRRQFALDKINLDMAIVQTDIALFGLRAYDVLEEYVGDLLSLYREASKELQKSLRYLDDIEILYSENRSQQEDQSSLARPMLLSILSSQEIVEEILSNSIPKALQPLKRRISWMSTQVEMSDAVDELVRKLNDATDGLQRYASDMRKRIKLIVDK